MKNRTNIESTFSTKKVLFTNQALWVLILPLFFEQLLTVLVGMADSVMVAQVGEAAAFTLPNVFRAANDVRFTMIVGRTLL